MPCARIKPYSVPLGHVGRSYVHMGMNRRFEAGRVYSVSDEEAEVLAPIKQPIGAKFLFDVCSEEEMSQKIASETIVAMTGVNPAAAALIAQPLRTRPGSPDPVEKTEAPVAAPAAAPAATTKGPKRKGGGA